MIRGTWLKGGVDGAIAYYTKHLEGGDYYLADKEVTPSLWMGEAAAHLGLEGQVTKEQFAALARNLHPTTEEKITQRMPRTEENKRRTFWDVTISPPKEFSILALMGEEKTKKQFRKLHREGMEIAAKEVEKHIGRRLRTNGQNGTLRTGEAVIATVEHETSRPVDGIPDPQLHTHMLFANVTRDSESGEFYALDNSEAVPALHMARQAYYSHLVKGVESLGYETETRESQGDFELVGFSDEVRRSFARRDTEIKERAQEKVGAFGMKDKAASMREAAKDSRSVKVELTDEERAGMWEGIAGKSGLAHISEMQSKAREGGLKAVESHKHSQLFESINHAKGTSFENLSVITVTDFEREVLRTGRGQFDLEEMRAAIKDDPNILVKGNEMTTREVIEEEKSLLSMIYEKSGDYPSYRAEGYEISPSPAGEDWEYNEEQIEAINGVLDNTDFVVSINGVAGAGKTSMLKEIESGMDANEIGMATLAPSNAAKNILKDEGFETAETLQQWLVNPKLRGTLENKSIVIDEAGMVSSRDMVKLCQLAEAHNNRLILVGDVKQLSSVQRGDGFRLIQDHTPAKTFTVEQSNRQKNQEYKTIANEIRHASSRGHWISAFEKLEDAGMIKEVSRVDDEGIDQSFEDLVSTVATQKLADENHLIVAANWNTIHSINKAVRVGLKEEGRLEGEELTKTVLQNRNLKPTEMDKARFYEAGDVIELTRNSDFGTKGEQFKVTDSKGNGQMLKVVDALGVTRNLPQGKLARESSLNVYRERTIDISKGDTILSQSNTPNFTNGELLKISNIDESGRIEVEKSNGKTHELEENFDKFVHSYAVTAHASQGSTVENVSVVADGMSKQALYVAATRGQQHCDVFTTNCENLKAKLTHSEDRKSATEFDKAPPILTTAQRVEPEKPRKFPVFRRNLQALDLKKILKKSVTFGKKVGRAAAREMIRNHPKIHQIETELKLKHGRTIDTKNKERGRAL